jgi:hypothetical protein
VTDEPRIVLEADGEHLAVSGPPDLLTDAVVEALRAERAALQLVVEVFGPVTVASAGTNPTWPPRGGFTPSWRRLSARKPLVVLPSEAMVGEISPHAEDPPAVSCPTCAVAEPAVSARVGDLYESGPWQVCSRCQGRRWLVTAHGDVCAACEPEGALAPPTWVRSGDGWVCSRCHPPVAPDDRPVCEICGGKGACRPDHPQRLRQLGMQLLKKTRSARRQAEIRAALDALPVVDVPAPEPSRHAEVVHGWRPPRTTTTTRQGREITWKHYAGGMTR